MNFRRIGILLLALLVLNQGAQLVRAVSPNQSETSRHLDRTIGLEIVINAPVERVWQAWTTRDGIRSFFAPDCDIDFRVLGKFDIWFKPSAPSGLRGAEGNLILAIQQEKML